MSNPLRIAMACLRSRSHVQSLERDHPHCVLYGVSNGKSVSALVLLFGVGMW